MVSRRTAAPNSDGGEACMGGSGVPLSGHRISGADIGAGGGATVIVSVIQCISSGIDNDATSTINQDVMCTCGFRTRRRLKPAHTTLPTNKERSADSARIASI